MSLALPRDSFKSEFPGRSLARSPTLSAAGRARATQFINSIKNKSVETIISLRAADVGFIESEFEKLKLAEICCTGLAALGFGCAAVSYDLLYTKEVFEDRRVETQILLHTGGISTILLLLTIVWRTVRELRWEQAKNMRSKRDNLYTTNKYQVLILELIVNAAYPVYWLERTSFDYENKAPEATIQYSYNSMLTIWTLVRLYHLVRLGSVLSDYRSGRAQRVCQMNGAFAGTWFAIRCMMKSAPFRMLAVMLMAGMLIGGFCLRIFERPMSSFTNQDFSEYGNTMWYILVTMTTVGYGDYFPVTLPGRMFGIVMCIWGVLVVSMFVVALTSLLNLESAEEKSLLILQRLSFKEDMRNSAAYVLTSALRYRWLSRHHPNKRRVLGIQLGKFRRFMHEFQMLKNQQRNLYDFDSQDDRIEGKVSGLLEQTEAMKTELNVLQKYAERLLAKTG